MSSSPSLIVTPFPFIRPTLPTELIEEILEQPSLSKADLASCCLVSNQFLAPARRSLYHKVTFTCCTALSGYGDTYAPVRSSLRLAQILSSSSTLSNLVKSLCCECIQEDFQGSYRGRGLIEILRSLLDKLVHVDQLYLRHSAFIDLHDYVRLRGSRWVALELVSADLPGEFVGDTPFPNLQRLKCQQRNWTFWFHLNVMRPRLDLSLPPRLRLLDLSLGRYTSISISNAASSSLRFLGISSISLASFPHLAQFSSLQHLWVKGSTQRSTDVAKVVDTITSCQSLISLTLFSFWLPWNQEILNLLERLPASISHLAFNSIPPLSEITVSVNRGFFKSIRILGLRRVYFEGDGDSREVVESLLDACTREGIEVDYIEGDFAPFEI